MEALNLTQLLIGTGIACLIAGFSYVTRALTIGGAATLVVMGIIIFGVGGWAFGVPILFFFISSSLLSRLQTTRKQQAVTAFDKTGARDYRQVLANGGIGTISTILYIVTDWPGWYLVYLAAIGEACADTWATEIGTLTKQPPRHILNMKVVEPGRSGGVTLLGTSAALTGSLLTVSSGYVMLPGNPSLAIDIPVLIFCICLGFAGSIVDSILGASVQAQYVNPATGKLTEKPSTDGQTNEFVGGFKFIDNDVVNTLSTLLAAAITAILAHILF